MKETNYNRYFLDTDPKWVPEDLIAIRKRIRDVEDGDTVSIMFKRGILNGPYSEEEKLEIILRLINNMEKEVERAQGI